MFAELRYKAYTGASLFSCGALRAIALTVETGSSCPTKLDAGNSLASTPCCIATRVMLEIML